MDNIKEIIIKSYDKMLKESGFNVTPSLDNPINSESGLDSLGFVNFILNLEDSLNISLDPILIDIRNSKDLNEIVQLVSEKYNI